MKARFTGHDTFPLRYGWLFKSIKYIKNNGLLSTSDADRAKNSISALGVGRNMVNSIKYWSESTAMIETTLADRQAVQQVTDLGRQIFDEAEGFDPYLEDIGTIWLIHFLLNFDADHLTAYRYFFNFSNHIYFEKSKLTDDLYEDAFRLTERDSFNISTVKKDVDCFLSTYIAKAQANGKNRNGNIDEDSFSSPLSELGLIVDRGRGFYQSDLGVRSSLPLSIFVYSLIRFARFYNKESGVNRMSFEDVLTRPLSPGRIFRLSEAALGQLLDSAVEATNKQIIWIDSLGLKQVEITPALVSDPLSLLMDYYNGRGL